jgi:fucose 4-O-acetylase-like acetyltransferase
VAPGVSAVDGAAAGRSGRIGWIDAARGIGILLVVIGHALGGLIDSPIGGGESALRQAFFAIYTFHMPLFLVLSGLMVPGRVARGRAAFLRSLGPGVVWPYFLWSTVQFGAIMFAGTLVNRPAGEFWITVAHLPWRTVSQFWFLYALFWMHLMAVAILPRGGAGTLLALGVVTKLACAVLPMDVSIRLVANNLAWYALGAVLAGSPLVAPARAGIAARPWRAGAAVALAATLIAAALVTARDGALAAEFAVAPSPTLANFAWRLWAVPAALAGVAAVFAVARLPQVAESRWLGMLGQRSMAIFVLHVMFVAGSRIFLLKLPVPHSATALLPVLVVIGVAGPLVVDRLLRPLGLRRWLGF